MALRKRGDVYWYDITVDGIRHRGSTKRHSKAEALAVEAEVRRQLLDAKQLGKTPEVTLKEALTLWFQRYGTRLKDRENISTIIRLMFGEKRTHRGRVLRKWVWPNVMLHAIDEKLLDEFIENRLEEGLSAASIRSELANVKRAVNWCRGRYRTPDVRWPSTRHDKRIKPTSKSRFLSEEEIAQIRADLDPKVERIGLPPYDRRNPRLKQQMQDSYDLFELLLSTGMRPGEAMALAWDDIDFDEGRIRVSRSKVSIWTGLAMSARARAILWRRHEEREDGCPWVFPDRRNPVEHRRQCRAIGRSMKRLGFNVDWKVMRYGGKAVTYTLRDSFASRLAQNRHTLQEIKTLLGHSTTRMTEKYAHLLPDDVASRAASTIDKLDT